MVNDFQQNKQINHSVCDNIPNACSPPPVAGRNSSSPAVSAGTSPAEMEGRDAFYEKLNKLNETSGLSLLFNFRDTTIDLYVFYKIVIERGGYHQVTKNRNWENIASKLNLKEEISIAPTQLQMIYSSILYQFEQTYHYRSPVKLKEAPIRLTIPLECRENLESSRKMADDSNWSTRKRKHCVSPSRPSSHFNDDNGDSPSKKIEYYYGSSKPSPVEEKYPVAETPPKVKETSKDRHAPLGARSCYHIFMKMECERQKKIYGESSTGQLRDMVIEAWRHLSDDDKLPYIEASKKDKERFVREMAEYNELKKEQQNESQFTSSPSITSQNINFSNQKVKSFTNEKVMELGKARSTQSDGDYYVALEPDYGDEIVDESRVQVAVQLMKNAQPNDPIFHINWDE